MAIADVFAVARLDTSGIRGELHRAVALAEKGLSASIKVRADTSSLRGLTSDLGGVRSAGLSAGGALLDLGRSGIRPLHLAAAAASPILVSLASSAGLASASLVAIGPAAIGAAAGLGTALLGFSEVAGALTAAAKASDAAEAAAAGLGKTSGDVAAAGRRVRDAEEGVAQAQVRTRRAQNDLNDARHQALRDLEDLQEKVSDLALDEEGAALAVQRARERLVFANADVHSSDLDRVEAAHDVRVAEERLRDVQDDRRTSAADLNKAQRDGVEAAPGVVAAHERITDANVSLRDSTEALADARAALTKAQQPAKDVAAANAQALFAARLAKLTPAGRDFVTTVLSMRGQLEHLQRTAESTTLPGFTRALKGVRDDKDLFKIMDRAVAGFGTSMSRTADRTGQFARSPLFKGALASILEDQRKSADNLGRAFTTLLPPVTRLFKAASPLVTEFTGYINTLATRFAGWIGGFSDKELADFFKGSKTELSKWWGTAENILGVVKNIFTASLPSGQNLATRIADFTGKVKDFTGSKDGQRQIKELFDKFAAVDYGQLVNIVGQVGLLAGVFKVGAFAVNHPILSLMGAFAAEYPAETKEFLRVASGSLVGIIRFASEHPDAIIALTALIGAYKGLEALKGFKFPSIPGLPSRGPSSISGSVTTNIVGASGVAARAGFLANPIAVVVENFGRAGVPARVPGGGRGAGTRGETLEDVFTKKGGLVESITNVFKGAVFKTALAAAVVAAMKTAGAIIPTPAGRTVPRVPARAGQSYGDAVAHSHDLDYTQPLDPNRPDLHGRVYRPSGRTPTGSPPSDSLVQAGDRALWDWLRNIFHMPGVGTGQIPTTGGPPIQPRPGGPRITDVGGTRIPIGFVPRVEGIGAFLADVTTVRGAVAGIPSAATILANLRVDQALDRKRTLQTELDKLRAPIRIDVTLNQSGEPVVISRLDNDADGSIDEVRFGRNVIARALGGAVFGRGGPRSDLIPAWLSNNEHVVAADEVDGFGGHRALEDLRRLARARAHGQQYADGGRVASAGAPNITVEAPIVRVYVGDREITESVRVVVDERDRRSAHALRTGRR